MLALRQLVSDIGNETVLFGELAKVPNTPGSLDEALDALEEDHDFLLKGEVFTSDVIETWIDYKMAKEVSAIRLRPHPYEFALYYDA